MQQKMQVAASATTFPNSSVIGLDLGDRWSRFCLLDNAGTVEEGLITNTYDPNGVHTQYTYNAMRRPTEIESFDSGSNEVGNTTYGYTPTQISTYQYQNNNTYGDTEALFDGYWRLSRTEVANGQTSNPWYQQDVCYNSNGRPGFQSYEYQGAGFTASKVCSGQGDSYSYDALGRTTQATHADGTSINYNYNGRATKTTDENGVSRITQNDGLLRLTRACEISSNSSMPGGSGSPASCGMDLSGTGFLTTYSYNLAAGQTTVAQGAQTRTFQIDWLGRPTSVTEPESGTATYSYSYNSTGLLTVRTRPRANQTNSSVKTTTTTQYDALGRMQSTVYNDGTPTRSYTYDSSLGWGTISQTYMKGRLSHASIPSAGTAYSYNAMGGVIAMDECLPSGCGNGADDKLLYYTYDWAGDLLTSTDGGGIQSTYTFSPASEVLSLTSSQNNSTNPPGILSNILNGPDGPVSFNLGNTLSSYYGYDTLGRLNGGWVCNGTPSANCIIGGQVYGFAITWKGQQLQVSNDSVLNQGFSYGYDEFNRLVSSTTNWGTVQNFSWVYDRWGNRWDQNVTAGSGPQPNLSFNTANNQVSPGPNCNPPNASEYCYDAAGNMTADGFHTYSYDAEGNVTAADGGSTAQYVYNALNQRVQTVAGGTVTDFLFNANGRRVSTWNGSTFAELKGQYYWGSKPVAFYTGGKTYFQHQDWLGTERMRTMYNGAVQATFTSLPWGDSQTTASGTDLDPYHFATLDYDLETDTDHAQFRQYSLTEGRWLGPDPYSGSYDFTNPQSLNRYTYVLNNPLSNIDPSGMDACVYDTGDGTATVYNAMDGGAIYCPGNGFYITTTQQVTGVGFDSNGDLSVYGADGNLYNPDGSAYDAAQSISVSADGDSVYAGPQTISSGNQYVITQPTATYSGQGYSRADVCAASALLHKGFATGLDAVGIIPGEGTALKAVQAGAGVVSAGIAVTGPGNNPITEDVALSGTGLGLTAVDSAKVFEAGTSAAKAVPIAGNILSGYATYSDLKEMAAYYNDCMAGKN